MDVLYFMVPTALLLSATALVGFIWATKTDQWESLDLESRKILIDTKTGTNSKEDTHE